MVRSEMEILEALARYDRELLELGSEVLHAIRRREEAGPEVDARRHRCHRLRVAIGTLRWVLVESERNEAIDPDTG